MKKLQILNKSLGHNRTYLLITLNILLIIFVILEVSILNIIYPNFGDVQAGSKVQLSSVGYHSN